MAGLVAAVKEWVMGEPPPSPYEMDYSPETEEMDGPRRRGRLYRLPYSREKAIYTITCGNFDDAHKAAQYLKAGSAVFVNLQSIDRGEGQRIVDVLTGVTYGTDGQYHAAGDRIFVFVPHDFQLTAEDKGHLKKTGLFVGGFEAPPPKPKPAFTDDPPPEMRTGLFARGLGGMKPEVQ